MALASITALVLLIVTILFTGFAIFSFGRALYITKNKSYLHIFAGVVLGFFASIFSSIANFYPNEEIYKGTVVIFVILANVCFSLSLFSFFNGLIFIKEDKLPIFSYISALAIGSIAVLTTNINSSNLLYNTFYSVWNVNYSSTSFMIVSIITQIIIITYFVLYLNIKIQKLKNYKRADISFVAILCLALWMLSTYFIELRALRFFLFPVSFGLFGLAVFLDPLNLLVTNELPSEIILVTKYGQPMLRYNVQNKRIDRNIAEVRLLIAGNKVISDTVKEDESPINLIMRNREAKIIELNNFYIISIGTKINNNVVSAIRTAFRDFESKTDLEYVTSSSVLNESDETLFTNIFSEHLIRIDGRKTN
ncbi:MAG: hypothetical protein KGD64_10195 [Candidatus Heimdallarchaeota archaeon]|nr:hypothetical protein [Candidatus Heimdallarchaeota archaeon]